MTGKQKVEDNVLRKGAVALGGSGPRSSSVARKRKSKPTKEHRSKTQRVKDRYAHAREDAQLAGLIPTVPEEALRDERVDPSSQGEQPLPGLVGQAIRRGWAVPDDRKPRLVDELMDIVENPEVSEVPKVMAYNALKAGDKEQWERDHPEDKGKAGVNVNIQNNVGIDLRDLFRRVDEQRSQGCGITLETGSGAISAASQSPAPSAQATTDDARTAGPPPPKRSAEDM